MDPSVLGPVSGPLVFTGEILIGTQLQPLASILVDIAIGVMALGL